jgi:paraquat-inducible protein B
MGDVSARREREIPGGRFLVRGGIAFATPGNPNMGEPVKPGQEFSLNGVPRQEWLRSASSLPLTKE